MREFGDEPDNYTQIQIKNFNEIIEKLHKEGIKVGLKHIMNSFGLLRFNDKNIIYIFYYLREKKKK